MAGKCEDGVVSGCGFIVVVERSMLGVKCENFGPRWNGRSDVSGCGFNAQKVNGGGRM